MAPYIVQGLYTIAVIAGAILLVGLYKPWIVLWWEDTQYRLKVIRLYGSVVVISLLIATAIESVLM